MGAARLVGPPAEPRARLPPGSPELKLAREIQHQLVDDDLHRLLVEYLVALLAMTMVVGRERLAAGRTRAAPAARHHRDRAAGVGREPGRADRARRARPTSCRELADTFDGMLARLDAAFASQRHFVANASHELRTPLAIMRTEVDVTLADPDATIDELRAMGEAVRETVDRCERLIGGLLMLARSEAAAGRGEPVDVAALAGDCITDLRARAREARRRRPRPPRACVDARRAGADRAPGREPARQRHPPQRAGRLPRGQHPRPATGASTARRKRRRRRSTRGGGAAGAAVSAAGPLRPRVRARAIDRALGRRGARRHDDDHGARRGRARRARRAAGAHRRAVCPAAQRALTKS